MTTPGVSPDIKKKQAGQLKAKHEQTIKNIKELQDLEKYMFQNLQELNKKPGDDSANEDQKKIVENRIKNLKAMRQNLFNKLKDMYINTQQHTHSNRKDLADQITMVQVMEEELNNVKTRYNQLQSEKANKIRMVELGDYEYDRYTAHKKIFKTVVYGAFAILIMSYLLHLPIFPTRIGILIVILIIAFVIINISSLLYDNARKDSLDYDKYNQGMDEKFNKDGATGAGNTGFFNRNAGALENLFKSKCKNTDGFRNMAKFTKMVIPAEGSTPITYAPLSIY